MASSEFVFLMGPLLVLVCVGLILFGIFTAQVYFYWLNYTKDPTLLKSFVFVLWIAEVLHTIFCIHFLYDYFILHFGDMQEVARVVWSVSATALLEVVIVSMTQLFSIYRIYKLSGDKRLLAFLPGALFVTRVVMGFVAASFLNVFNTWASFREQKGPLTCLNISLALGGLVDLMTTSMLSYYLLRSRSGFKRTNHIVEKLITFSLNTGAITMIFSMAILITFNVIESSLLWAGLVEVISKLYANAMLVMLNVRQSIKNEADTSVTNTIPLEFRRTGPGSAVSHTVTDEMRINVYKDTTVQYDIHSRTGTKSGDFGDTVKTSDPLV